MERLFPDPISPDGVNFPWMCRWDDLQLVVWAPTIEQARLAAREHAGPVVPVSARLATHSERDEAKRQ